MAERLQALRTALAAHPGEPVPFDRLITAVWPDTPPVHPLSALRTLVRRLRGTEQISTEPSGYRLVPRPPAPNQLPADLPDFVGRREELTRLSEVDEPVRAITGLPGIGKTVLAVREAHRLRPRFPDGQLYVDLRAYSAGPSLTVEQALTRFVKALGGGPNDDYRHLLKGRRVLVVLDNATAEVITPLLPDTPGCAALITSREDMPEFAQVRLGVLAEQEAQALLAGMRVDGDTSELIKLCAHLPLALRIAGANLTGRHLPDYVEELREHRLAALEIEDDDTAVHATFDLSYRKLTPRARRTFDFLGAVPGPDIPRELVDDAIDELVSANLVAQTAPGRFHQHDLLRLYAHARATDADRRAVFAWYLARIDGADARLDAPIKRMLPPVPDLVPFASQDEAMAWFEAERHNIVALAQDRPSAALLAGMRRFLTVVGYHVDLHTMARAVLDGGAAGEFEPTIHGYLGFLEWRFGRHDLAIWHTEQAIAQFSAAGLEAEEAGVLNTLAGIYFQTDKLALAHETMTRAIKIYVAHDRRPQLIGGLCNIGLLELELGELDAAEASLRRCVELAREDEDWLDVANGLCSLGTVLTARREHAEAEQAYLEGLELVRTMSLRQIETATRVEYAELLVSTGRFEEAAEHAAQALELDGGADLSTELSAQLVLAEVHRSVAGYDDVLDQATEVGLRIIEVRALAGKAAVLHPTDPDAANALWDKAIERAEEAGLRYRADAVMAGRC